VTLPATALLGAAVIELLAREVARRSMLAHLIGWVPSPWTIAAIAVAAAAIAALGRRRQRPLLFGALFAAGLAAQVSLGARLQSDGFYYFAYLRSIAFDGDVEFSNDYRLLGLGDKPHLFQPTATGHAHSAWTIGPAIVWAPFFAGGHAVAQYLHARDPNVSTNGISFPYRQAVCVAGLVYGLLGCWFMYRLASRYFDKTLAGAAVTLVTAGSFMLWYLVKEPSMTHAPSMAVVAGFAWMWSATSGRRTTTQWMILGAIGGLMTLIRWQNALFAVLPVIDAVQTLIAASRRGDRAGLRRTIGHGLLFTAAATVAFVPQMLAWKAIYGSWLAVSPLGPQIRFADPQLVDILWSSRNGLLSTSPALYVGAIGLVMLAWIRPVIGVPALLAVALMTYFNACVQDWWGSAGFGGRRFDGTLPFFCLGVAQAFGLALAFLRRFPATALWCAGTVLVLWNLTLMTAANAGVLRLGEAASFGDLMAVQGRIFHRWFGNPFTFPASLLFAMRNGVSPAHYDLLAGNRFLGDPLRPYGRIEVGGDDQWLIDEGWHQPEQEGTVSFRWATARASLLIPLDHTDDLRVQVRLHAFGYPGAPEQTVNLAVNGQATGSAIVSPGWHTAEIFVPRARWREGVNHVSLVFGWERRPAEVGLGGDARPLAGAVDYVRIAVPER
jgi:hypothetical protein